MKQSLALQDYEALVHLGCSAEEREIRQEVRFNLNIKFQQNVTGAVSDKLDDVVDYVEVTEIIRSVAQAKAYNLIEHLNLEVIEALLIYLKAQKIKADVHLSVQKIKVPVENLKNGVVFTCEASV